MAYVGPPAMLRSRESHSTGPAPSMILQSSLPVVCAGPFSRALTDNPVPPNQDILTYEFSSATFELREQVRPGFRADHLRVPLLGQPDRLRQGHRARLILSGAGAGRAQHHNAASVSCLRAMNLFYPAGPTGISIVNVMMRHRP